MKKGDAIVVFFFTMWGICLILVLMKNNNIEFSKLIMYSLGFCIPATLLYIIFRRPLLRAFRWMFNKDYRLSKKSRRPRKNA